MTNNYLWFSITATSGDLGFFPGLTNSFQLRKVFVNKLFTLKANGKVCLQRLSSVGTSLSTLERILNLLRSLYISGLHCIENNDRAL